MYQDLEELAEKVKRVGILSLPMEQVREAHGAGRLGVTVRSNISKSLDGLGIGHYPLELPDSQRDWVRLTHKGSPISDLINAVLDPSETNDGRLRDAVNNEDQRILQQIKELVCD